MAAARRYRSEALIGIALAVLLGGCGGPGATISATTASSSSASAGNPPVIAVTLTDAGCTPKDFSLHPGTTVFSVTNRGSTKVKEMEIDDKAGHSLGDVEGVEPGETSTFVVDLKPGTFEVHCPQDAPTFGTLSVG